MVARDHVEYTRKSRLTEDKSERHKNTRGASYHDRPPYWRPVMPQLVPCHNWSPGPSAANYVAVDGPRTKYGCHGWSVCHKWSPGSKRKKQRRQILTDEVTIKKLFGNNATHVCCTNESSLAVKTTFSFTHSRILNVIWATTG